MVTIRHEQRERPSGKKISDDAVAWGRLRNVSLETIDMVIEMLNWEKK